ncbi:MAG: hypothetical protein ACLSVV_04935 [Bacteroides xylanisolvens]
MDRLILLVESRIRGDVYVRFGGELPKTHRSNTAGRWMLSLPLAWEISHRYRAKNSYGGYAITNCTYHFNKDISDIISVETK